MHRRLARPVKLSALSGIRRVVGGKPVRQRRQVYVDRRERGSSRPRVSQKLLALYEGEHEIRTLRGAHIFGRPEFTRRNRTLAVLAKNTVAFTASVPAPDIRSPGVADVGGDSTLPPSRVVSNS